MLPIPTPIYHFSHINNLASIIEANGILCKNVLIDKENGYTNSANEDVQDKRKGHKVTVANEGTLHDYVPFYFATRTPMLYTVHQGNISGVNMKDVVFFKSNAQEVKGSGKCFAFTDGHGIMALSDYYEDLADLEKVPWNVIKAPFWNDFTDGRRLRQSEFLVHSIFDWALIEVIGVFSEEMRTRVQNLILNLDHKPEVQIKKNWYF